MSKKLTKATDRGRKICITCGALLNYKSGEYHCFICGKDIDTLSLQLHVTKMLNEARALATKRMVEEAEGMKADAVVNIRYATSAIMQGAAEVMVYGTAVKFE